MMVMWWAAPAAQAHLRSGTLAVDYRVSLWDPATAAYDARIYESDHGLTLTVHPGHVIVLLGYLGEPVFRLDGRGLAVNAASPTAAAVRLLAKGAAADSARPVWREHGGRRSVTWHDARAQGLPSGLRSGVWRVPLLVDGRRVWLQGELRRFPRPTVSSWVAVLVAWLLAALGLLRGGGRSRARAAGVLAGIAAGAATAATIGFALDAYASPGTWILGFDAIVFLAAGLAVLLRGPAHLRPAGAIGTGLVALAMGLFMIPVFLHPIVLSVIPATVTRLLVVSAVGAGAGTSALGGWLYSETAAGSAVSEPESWTVL
jgi:hypothetical protein